jgi:hypothetical protein
MTLKVIDLRTLSDSELRWFLDHQLITEREFKEVRDAHDRSEGEKQ